MRFTLASALLFVAAVCHGSGDAIEASGTLDGKKVWFPAKSLAEGARATIDLLESCHDASDDTVTYTLADLKKAQKGDHVRLVFAKPVTVTVLRDKLKVSELILTQPLNTGVFWLRCSDKVVRCTKYEFKKEKPFLEWRRQARLVK
jgi:hypothetical protein